MGIVMDEQEQPQFVCLECGWGGVAPHARACSRFSLSRRQQRC